MAGQGHQFPGNFQGNAGAMRSGFGGGPMSNQMQAMPNQMAGVMGGPMGNTGMVGMGNQMVPPYGAAMPGQMGSISMSNQGMGVGVGTGQTGHGPQAVQQTSMQVAAVQAAPPPAPVSHPPQNKEFNTASLCKFGQETVQDIVSRTQDVFQTLKAIQPPNGTQHGENASNDKKAKMQEQLRTIRLLFKRLRLIYEKCNETCQGMEYTHMESLIPLKDEADNKALDERRNTESYRLVSEENRELTEQGMGVGVGTGQTGHGPQAVQQTSMQVAAVQAAPPPAPVSHPPQNKEFNTASLCKFGQETVQDIVSRTQDVFQTLKAIQPPNGTQHGENASNDKKAKMQEQLRTIRLLFKRLRLIYEKCNETCQGMEYTHMESLIPLKDEADNKALDERRNTESYRLVSEENRELTEQVVLKNKQLREVITNLRTIIWEINVMLTMRRS